MKDAYICACFLNATELKLLAELDDGVFEAHDDLVWRRLAMIQLETKEVSVHILELADLRIHQAQLSELLVLEADWVCANLLNL